LIFKGRHAAQMLLIHLLFIPGKVIALYSEEVENSPDFYKHHLAESGSGERTTPTSNICRSSHSCYSTLPKFLLKVSFIPPSLMTLNTDHSV
jgi:hypothetical protein